MKVRKLMGWEKNSLAMKKWTDSIYSSTASGHINQIFRPDSLAKSQATNSVYRWDSCTFYVNDSYECWCDGFVTFKTKS